VELTLIDVRDPAEIERAVTAFARGPNGGLITTTTVLTHVRRQLIITLAGRHGFMYCECLACRKRFATPDLFPSIWVMSVFIVPVCYR
jgi:hypothetical protein